MQRAPPAPWLSPAPGRRSSRACATSRWWSVPTPPRRVSSPRSEANAKTIPTGFASTSWARRIRRTSRSYAAAHGPLRGDGGGLRSGQGEERAARAGESVRPLPQGSHGRRGARLADGGRPAPSPRDLRDLRRRRGARAVEHGLRPPSLGRCRTPRHHRRRVDGHAVVPEHRIEMPNFATDSAAAMRAVRRPGGQRVPPVDHGRGLRRGGDRPGGRQSGRGLRPLVRVELDWYEDIGLCGEGEAEKLLRDGVSALGGRVPVNPSGGLSCFGEAIPAQAIAQVCECVWQLRGDANGAPSGGCPGGGYGEPGPLRPRFVGTPASLKPW